MTQEHLDVSGNAPCFAAQLEAMGVDHRDPANAYVLAVAALTVAEQLLHAVIKLQEESRK